ncbi:MAG: hypothetical protein J6Y48_15125 [Clostridia bacterium]|nr:hypothetical protein [Clostridia bacterium]
MKNEKWRRESFRKEAFFFIFHNSECAIVPAGCQTFCVWILPEPQDIVYRAQAVKNKGCMAVSIPKKA